MSQTALVSIGDPAQRRDVAERRILRQLCAQDDDVVVLTEPRFCLAEHAKVVADAETALVNQAQLVPQRLDLLPPFVEFSRALMPPDMRQRFASSAIRRLDAGRERAEAAMPRPPSVCLFSQLAEVSIHTLPDAVFQGGFHRRLLVGRKLTSYPRERMFVERVWMLLPELRQDCQHRVGITKSRQCAVDLSDTFPASGQSAAVVRRDQVHDGTDLLDALSRLMD